MSSTRALLLSVALVAAPSVALRAQSLRATEPVAADVSVAARHAIAQRADRAPAIDGVFDDVVWRTAPVLGDFIQQSPDENRRATQRTEVRMIMDDVALYVAMRLFDTAPDSIAAPLARRDYVGYSDWAHVLIDSYHDRRTAFRFAVNPSGVKRDGYISGDAEWNEDPAWDAVWDAATRRDSTGWTAEFRIPLSQLRFSAGTGAKEWGIEFIRDLARRDERTMWAPITRSGDRFVSLFGTLERVQTDGAPRRMELTPYTVARRLSNAVETNPLERAREATVTMGADFKLGITSDLTLTGTLNPDFGQIEADPSEVNLTGSETFLRERRPFFVDGGDLFQYRMTAADWVFGEEQLFYSRRIGRAPQGTLPSAATFTAVPSSTSLLGAAKLTGLVRGWRVGALSVMTPETRGRYVMANGSGGTAVVEPLSHYGVMRISRDFDEGNSSLGVIATTTNRHLTDSSTVNLHSGAYSGGVEGRWRFGQGRKYSLAGYVMGSMVRGSRESIVETQTSPTHYFQRPDDALRVDSSATSLGGVASELRFEKTGTMPFVGLAAHVVTPGFDVNDLGFQTTSGYRSSVAWFGWDLFTPTRLTRQRSAWFNVWSQWGQQGDRRVAGGTIWTQATLHNFWQLTASTQYRLPGRSTLLLRGGPAVRTPSTIMPTLRLTTDPRRALVGGVGATVRRSFGEAGSMVTIAPVATVRPSGRLELEVRPSVAWTRDPSQYVATTSARGTQYLVGDLHQRTTSLTARMNLAFTTALTLQGYAQPFVSSGRYGTIGEVVSPMAARVSDRIRAFDDADRARVDNPDFNVGDFNANLVLRWEYRPGSALFVVWNQRRTVDDINSPSGIDELGRALWQAPASTALLLKWSHYFGR